MLSADDMAAMRDHLERCASCSALDTRVRRGLLVFRNAPDVECSPDFAHRLQVRLRELGPVDRYRATRARFFFAAARYVGFAASLVLAGAIGAYATGGFERGTPEVRMAPVVAVATMPDPEPLPTTVANPAYVASVMSGMPVWPAILVAGESSAHMANYEYQLMGYTK